MIDKREFDRHRDDCHCDTVALDRCDCMEKNMLEEIQRLRELLKEKTPGD